MLEFLGRSRVLSAAKAALFACWRDLGIRKSTAWKKLGMVVVPACCFSTRNMPGRLQVEAHLLADSRPARASDLESRKRKKVRLREGEWKS